MCKDRHIFFCLRKNCPVQLIPDLALLSIELCVSCKRNTSVRLLSISPACLSPSLSVLIFPFSTLKIFIQTRERRKRGQWKPSKRRLPSVLHPCHCACAFRVAFSDFSFLNLVNIFFTKSLFVYLLYLLSFIFKTELKNGKSLDFQKDSFKM